MLDTIKHIHEQPAPDGRRQAPPAPHRDQGEGKDPAFPTSIRHHAGGSARAIRQEKEIEGI